ncbi:MAG: glycerophosphodiester phosphodiesterase [Bacilli bacterium]|nr:glycerophosphodiester phosphodiesterase [Bacilli bacterium]
MSGIKVIAHRGGYKESGRLENSKEAIQYAISKSYIDGVEFDIRVTSDRKIVLIHNASIKYNNKRYRVSNMSYEEFNQIYFKVHHTNLCTLEDVLSLIPKNKYVFLEIKNMSSKKEKEYLELIYNTIKKYPSKRIIIISFLYKYLKYFILKGFPTCLLLSRKSRFFEFKVYFRLYLTLKLTMISLDKEMVHRKNSTRILRNNKLLGVYTIHHAPEIDRILHQIGTADVKKYQNNIYITTTNPKKVYERIQKLNE